MTTSTPRTADAKASSLCDLCKQMQDLDRLTDHKGPIMHHKSWTALCQSAENGCHLCNAFVQLQDMRRAPGIFDSTRNFDEHMSWPDTQLTIESYGINSPLHLRQDALFHHPHQEVIYIWFELCPDHDDPLSAIFTARSIDCSSDSENCLGLLDRWIKSCQAEHPECIWSKDHILPTRVIDVGSEDNDPFLFESNGAKGEWLTLSHCWGGSAPLQTTSHSLQHHKASISMKSLPVTFRDAIILTRRLGYQYIWIDSLCIIHNIHEDWITESSQMFRVYGNASINISATAARSPKEGIFESGSGQRNYATPLTKINCRSETKGIEGVLGVRLRMDGTGPFETFTEPPLHRRAWVLQESVLSPRRIDFASTQLYWECRTVLRTEGYPDSDDGHNYLTGSGRQLHKAAPRKMEYSPDIYKFLPTAKDPLSWWYTMLNDSYRDREITMDCDVFPALAGVAEEVARRTGFEYKSGLWLEDLHRGLLWQSSYPSEKSKDDFCPSWSWASVKLGSRDRRLDLETYAEGHRATILDISVKSEGENELGRISAGTARLKCSVKAFSEWREPQVPVYNGHGDDFVRMSTRYVHPKDLIASESPPTGQILCTLDIRPDDVDACLSDLIQRGAICAQIASFKTPECRIIVYDRGEKITDWGVVIYGLVLEPVDETAQAYRRIGIVEIAEEDGLADGWETTEVVIV
ncbi:hypothetical protein ONS95_012877 [Cadophora gregata]|uniref:uncharacterized protein n=1 Tax=Cadophora gregata TaxID=51156 RepID=UPI0026DC7EC1|nr:uncharacterized protein ONS95_012877 [Cadophora gregata]KAK0101141.1 hypothetical protein ONS96_006366 [Cadophora gregata f. sp. sojae]KAK0115826.1 hypothetical protein ONS95_012877 [Cadophora gregata]